MCLLIRMKHVLTVFHENIIIMKSPPITHIIFRSPRNLTKSPVPCFSDRILIAFYVNKSLQRVLCYEFIIAIRSEKEIPTNAFLVARCIGEVSHQ